MNRRPVHPVSVRAMTVKTIAYLSTVGCFCLLFTLTSAQGTGDEDAYSVDSAHSRLLKPNSEDQRYPSRLPHNLPYSLSPSARNVQPVFRQLPVPHSPSHPSSNFRYFSSNASRERVRQEADEEPLDGENSWSHSNLQEVSGLPTSQGVVRSPDSSSEPLLFDSPPLSEVGDLDKAPPALPLPNTDSRVRQAANASSLEGQETVGDEYFDDYSNAHQDYPAENEDLFPPLNATEDAGEPRINVSVVDPGGSLTKIIHNEDRTVTQNPLSLDSVDNRLEPVGMPTSQHEVAVTPPTLMEEADETLAQETEQPQDYVLGDYNDTLTGHEETAVNTDANYDYYDQGNTGGDTHQEVGVVSELDSAVQEAEKTDEISLTSTAATTTTETTTTTAPPPSPAIGGAVSVVSYGDAEDGYHPSNHDDISEDQVEEVAEATPESTSSSTTERATTTTTSRATTTSQGKSFSYAPRTTPKLFAATTTTTPTTTSTRATTTTTTAPPTSEVAVEMEEIRIGDEQTEEKLETSTTTAKPKQLISDMVANLTAFLDTLHFNEPAAEANVTEKMIDTTPKSRTEEPESTKNRSPLPSFKEILVLKPSYAQKPAPTTNTTASTTSAQTTLTTTTSTAKPTTTEIKTTTEEERTSKSSKSETSTTSRGRARTQFKSLMSNLPTEGIPMDLLPPGFSTEEPVTVLLVPLKSRNVSRGRKLSSRFDQYFEKHKNQTAASSSSSSASVTTEITLLETNSSNVTVSSNSTEDLKNDTLANETTEATSPSRKRIQNLSRKPFLFTRSGPSATRAPVKIAARKTSDILKQPRVTLRPIGRRINTNVHEGEYQSDPDSRTDSSVTQGPPTTTTRKVVTTLSPYFLWGQSVEVASIMKIEEGAEWSPQLEDHRSPEYQELANDIEKQLDNLFRSSDFGGRYKGIQIEGFSKGSVIVDYTLYLTETDEPVETPLLWEAISKVLENGTNMGSYVVDPGTLSFEVIRKITPPPEVNADNLLLPHWAIAVIVIAAASFLFLIILCLALTRNKRGAKRKLYGNVLQEDSITERAKNWDKSTYDNLGAASSIYDANDTWDEKKLKQQQRNYNYNLYSVNPPSTGYYAGQKHSHHGSLNKLDREPHQHPQQQPHHHHHQPHTVSGGSLQHHYPPSHHSNAGEDPYGRYYDSWRSEWSRITKGTNSSYKPPDYDTTF